MGMMGGFGMMSGLASGGSGGYSWGWLMMLFLVLLIVGIALIVVWLFRQGYITGTGDRGGDGTHSEKGIVGQSALNILKQRYARGEIAKEQYDQIKLDIEAD
jgi:putative membrane protein